MQDGPRTMPEGQGVPTSGVQDWLPNPEDDNEPISVPCDGVYRGFHRWVTISSQAPNRECHADAPSGDSGIPGIVGKAVAIEVLLRLGEKGLHKVGGKAASLAARAIPGVGYALLAYDVVRIIQELQDPGGVEDWRGRQRALSLEDCKKELEKKIETAPTSERFRCAPCFDDPNTPCMVHDLYNPVGEGSFFRQVPSDDPCVVECEFQYLLWGAVACFCPTDFMTGRPAPTGPTTKTGGAPSAPTTPGAGPLRPTTPVPPGPTTGPVPPAPDWARPTTPGAKGPTTDGATPGPSLVPPGSTFPPPPGTGYG